MGKTYYVNLWELLGKKRMNVKTLAKITGISEQQLSKIKHGKTTAISFTLIDKLTKALDCTIGDLIKYE